MQQEKHSWWCPKNVLFVIGCFSCPSLMSPMWLKSITSTIAKVASSKHCLKSRKIAGFLKNDTFTTRSTSPLLTRRITVRHKSNTKIYKDYKIWLKSNNSKSKHSPLMSFFSRLNNNVSSWSLKFFILKRSKTSFGTALTALKKGHLNFSKSLLQQNFSSEQSSPRRNHCAAIVCTINYFK